MIVVSACLAGEKCAFDGKSRLFKGIAKLVRMGKAIPVCPETLGGLKTPRQTAEIVGGDGRGVLKGYARVVTKSGRDVTKNFLSGSKMALGIARRHSARFAILKAKSPSCGCGLIYDGTFMKCMKQGDGVAAALFKKEGIVVTTEFEKDRVAMIK